MASKARGNDIGFSGGSFSSCLEDGPSVSDLVYKEQILSGVGCCRLIPGTFTKTECLSLIRRAQSVGYSKASLYYPPSYRNNERLVIDDHEFADRVFRRVRGQLPQIITDPDRTQWKLVGINERFRLCRYESGQFFKIHRDGVYHRNDKIQSKLTFMVYLNGREEFDGGLTRFFESRDPQSQVIASIPPLAGSLIYFDHDLWHDGQELLSGEKFIMRSDILYERVSPCMGDSEPTPKSDHGHSGYIWTLAELPNELIATGGRDKTIKIWKTSVAPTWAQTLTGHQSSVTSIIALRTGDLWSASRDQTIQIWKHQVSGRFEHCRTLQGHRGAILALSKSSDDSIVATGSADHSIRLWRPDGQIITDLQGHSGWVWSIQFLGPRYLVSASEDGTVRLWSLDTMNCLDTYSSGSAPLRTLIVSSDARQIAVGQADGVITIWAVNRTDLQSAPRLLLRHTFVAHSGEVRTLCFLKDGILVSGAEDDQVKFWSPIVYHHLLSGSHGDFVTTLTQLSDGRLLSTSYDGQIKIWDLPQKEAAL
jgi:WD40 repeat protein